MNLNPLKWFKKESTLSNPDDELIDALTGGYKSSTGVSVTEQRALQISAVYACIRVLSTTFAALPLHLKKRDGENIVNASDHPLYELLHILPNEETTAYNHRQMLMSAINLNGTSYNELSRDGRGTVREIVPLCGSMKVDRNKSGKLVYEYYDGSPNRIIANNKMWRIPGYTENGIIGKSPLTIARETFGHAIAANDFSGAVFQNGAKNSVALKVKQNLSDPEKRKDILKAWNDSFAGISNAGKTALLHNDADLINLSMNMVDAQFLETMKFNRTEIAGFFGVPPHMIADLDGATFSNIEEQSLNFVIYSLLPHLVNFEQSVYRDLLTPQERKKYFVKFNVQGLLRGDSKSRAEFYRTMFNIGAKQRNEIRRLEEDNPIAGGDNTYMQTNMGRIDENGDVTTKIEGKTNENTQQINESNQGQSESD